MTQQEVVGILKCLKEDLSFAVDGEKNTPIVCVIRERIDALTYAISKLEENAS